VVLNADGSVSFTPLANFNGAGGFAYVLSDGEALSAPVSVVVNVQPVNDAPVALPDVLAATEDTTARFDAAALLGNDSDVDGPALRITSVTSGSGGSAALNADGSVSFTPAQDFNGMASFAYVASDGELTSTATATVNVAAVNDAPVARPDALVATEDTAIVYSAAELLGNDSDVEASPLRIAAIGAASGGSAVLQADGSVRFTPAQNFNGTAGFSYTASDGAATSNTAAVTITVAAVNDAPTGGADALAMPEDQPTTFAAALLLGNDADVEGSALRIVSVTNGSGGTVVLNADGSVTFSPIGNFNGAANFSYVVSDGAALSAPISVVVNVQAVNDAPVAAPDSFAAVEDTPLTLSAAALLGNDTDVDGPALRITSVTSGNGGSAVLNVDGSVSFTPAGNFNGTAGFSYTASDGEFTSPASVTLNVAAVNDAPQANPDSAATPRNRPLLLSAATLLANDTDVDDAVSLRLTSVQAPNNGTVNLDASGNAVFVPTTGYIGPASFSYTVSDAAGATSTTTVAVTVDLPISGPLLEAPATVLSVVEGTATAGTLARILQSDLESTLGLSPGFLDGFDPPPGPTSTHLGLVNTVSGGHVNQTVQLQTGETIALDWSFFNGENLLTEIQLGYNDLLLLIVTDPTGNRQITQLTSTEQVGINLNDLAADATGTFQFSAVASGEHQFTWVVTNGRDTTKDSRASIAPVRHLLGGNSFGTPVALDITAQSIDPAAEASLLVSVAGVPAGAAFSAGTDLGAGRWSFTAPQLDGLEFLPPGGFAGSISLTLTASTVDAATGTVETIDQPMIIVIDATANSVMGTQVANLLSGTPTSDYFQGYDGNDLIQGAQGNDILHGDAGNDTLEGDAGADLLYGGVGTDTLVAGDGDDQLFGGVGNDSHGGGEGSDVFAWRLADRGTVGNPASDIVVDFAVTPVALGGDLLDLRDLLVGETATSTSVGNLEQYLDFDTTSTTGSTLIRISSGGTFAGGAYSAAAEDQRITLLGLDLRTPGALGLSAGASDGEIILQLLQRGHLHVDAP
jgi:Cadherin-like domain/Bacterial Ig domain/RTX calcium-binding nonapeptide repeat (4 copies)